MSVRVCSSLALKGVAMVQNCILEGRSCIAGLNIYTLYVPLQSDLVLQLQHTHIIYIKPELTPCYPYDPDPEGSESVQIEYQAV